MHLPPAGEHPLLVKVLGQQEQGPSLGACGFALRQTQLTPLLRALKLQTPLRQLRLSGNTLDDSVAGELLATLGTLPHLTLLDLSDNQLGAEGLRKLVPEPSGPTAFQVAWGALPWVGRRPGMAFSLPVKASGGVCGLECHPWRELPGFCHWSSPSCLSMQEPCAPCLNGTLMGTAGPHVTNELALPQARPSSCHHPMVVTILLPWSLPPGPGRDILYFRGCCREPGGWRLAPSYARNQCIKVTIQCGQTQAHR